MTMTNPYATLTVSDKITEGRKRILTCLSKTGADRDAVSLLELQKQYFTEYDQYLNKDELRRFFSKTHIKQVFENFMLKDVEMTTDVDQTGSLYLRLLRPLEVALSHGPFQQTRSAVSKVEKNPKNLVPLPKSKFEVPSVPVRQINEFTSLDVDEEQDRNKMTNKLWSEQIEKKSQQTMKDLINSRFTSSDEEGNEEHEESSQFGDDALEAGNRILSSATELDKNFEHKKTVGIRTSSHADKYLLEALKKRKENQDEQKSKPWVADDSEGDEEKRKFEKTLARMQKRIGVGDHQVQSIGNAIAQQYCAMKEQGNVKGLKGHNYGNDLLDSSDDEEEDGDDPLIIMTDEQKSDKKCTLNSSPEEIHDMVDEQFYQQMATETADTSSNTLLGNVLSDEIRYYFTAAIPFMVQMKMLVKASDLHTEIRSAEMLPFRPFKSSTDLVKFVRQNCASMVNVVELPNDDNVFIWKKKQAENEKYSLDHLIQKVGKTLEQ